MTAIVACASHLLVDLPLFGGPAVTVIGAVVLMARSERRRAARVAGGPEADGSGAASPEADRPESLPGEAAGVTGQRGAPRPAAAAHPVPAPGAGGA